MEKHTCKTYFSVYLDFDKNKAEVERYIVDNFDIQPKWSKHSFVLGVNENYSVDVNDMIRITLKNLIGKERKIKELCQSFGVKTSLVVVPYIASESKEPKQILSFAKDIMDFLYESGTSIDLDYYVI